MTTREFQKEFETAASFIDTLKDIRIVTEDISYFLNDSQHVYVNKRLQNLKNNIEGSQKEIDELRELVVRNTVLTLSSSTTAYNVYALPENYLYLLNDRTSTIKCTVTAEYPNRLTKLEDLHTLLNYKYTKTKFNDPISNISGNNLYIYKDSSFTIDTVSIDYIRTFSSINLLTGVTSELNANVHKDIVQLAVLTFLESIQSNRFNSNINKNVITQQV